MPLSNTFLHFVFNQGYYSVRMRKTERDRAKKKHTQKKNEDSHVRARSRNTDAHSIDIREKRAGAFKELS